MRLYCNCSSFWFYAYSQKQGINISRWRCVANTYPSLSAYFAQAQGDCGPNQPTIREIGYTQCRNGGPCNPRPNTSQCLYCLCTSRPTAKDELVLAPNPQGTTVICPSYFTIFEIQIKTKDEPCRQKERLCSKSFWNISTTQQEGDYWLRFRLLIVIASGSLVWTNAIWL